jgi:FkbM family methyltransferase
MLKSALKRTMRHLGFDLRRYRPDSSENARLTRMLALHKVNLVFDIGANIGQFGKSLREVGYMGRIVSFEPISACWEQLVAMSRTDPLWEIAPRSALGEEDGEIEMHVSRNSVSSSVLDMLSSHLAAAPDSGYVRNEITPLRRLDTVGEEYLREDSRLFIKMDTQGYEAQVLQGAENTLHKAIGLHVELSLVPIYAGQLLYDDIVPQLKGKGFELWDINPFFIDPRSGRLLCADGTFFRPDLA